MRDISTPHILLFIFSVKYRINTEKEGFMSDNDIILTLSDINPDFRGVYHI